MYDLKPQILSLLKKASQPLTVAEISAELSLPRHLKKRVVSALESLVKEGRAAKNARHRYSVPERSGGAKSASKEPLRGRFMLSGRGSAFVRVEGRAEDFAVPDRFRGWALPDDEVEIRPLPPRDFKRRGGPRGPKTARRDAAEVLRVLRRGREQWVGRYRRQGGDHWIDVVIGEMELELDMEPPSQKISDGDWIVVSAPGLDTDGGDPASGRLLSRLGGDDTPHLDTLILIKRAGLPEEFAADAVDQAKAYGAQVPGGALEGRLDLRKAVCFTIDGEDAKDFDDAVSIETSKDGWKLGVHIADVSEYVKPGTPLDREALKRGTSTYLPDRVLPMLPEALSNGLCSLNEKVDRLTMSVHMEISKDGRLGKAEYHRSVIHSVRRCTYREVEDHLESGKALERDGQGKVSAALKVMRDCAKARLKQRMSRGALDFNFPETKCELDAKGKPLRLFRLERLFAHRLIEEFMLSANEAVARGLRERGAEFLYRIHEKPEPEKMADTLNILSRLKVGLKGMDRTNPTPKEIQKLLDTVAGTPAERTAHTLLLRSLKLARYAPEAEGHFGLALQDYAHFTSPIRRYPDLHVHRLVKAVLCSAPAVKESMPVAALGEHCSRLERRAEQVERQCVKAKQMRYLEERLGQTFDATVTSVGAFGYFAEIDEFPAEGMVRMGRLLDDLYTFDEDRWCLRGMNRGKQISIGDKVRVEVERADWETLQADFTPSPLKKRRS